MAGTPNMEVTRCRAIRSRARAGSNADSIRTVPPFRMAGRQSMFSAAVWNSGATTRAISSWPKSASTRTLMAFPVMFPCVSVAPLARPVVPDVYMIRQGSPRLTGSSAGPGGAAGRDSSVSRSPLPERRGVRRGVDERRPPRVREVVGQFRPGEAHVQRDEYRAQRPRGEQGLQVGLVVGAEVREPRWQKTRS